MLRRFAPMLAVLLVVGVCGCTTGGVAPPSPTRTVEPFPEPAVPAASTTASTPPLPEYLVHDFGPVSGVDAPYSDRPQVDVHAKEIDEDGAVIYRDLTTGEPTDHPVAYAQYGISALLEWARTGDALWLDRAIANGDRLLAMHVDRDGAMWFPYGFDWTYYERTLTEPWWSGMAQGEVLSLLSRLAVAQPEDPRWRAAADSTFRSFLQPRIQSAPWSTFVSDSGYLWFEEYAGDQPPLQVFNGQIFAVFGLYDYVELTGDPEARSLFVGGATTALDVMPQIRVPGGVSYYCVQAGYCQSPDWQNSDYHPIHIWQLDTLSRLTGDAAFAEWARALESDRPEL